MMSSESPGPRTSEPSLEHKESNLAVPGVSVASASVFVNAPNKKPEVTVTDVDDEAIERIETPLTERKNKSDHELNGFVDQTDGALMIEKQEEKEEDGCGIKCLYYTLQCCECAVM